MSSHNSEALVDFFLARLEGAELAPAADPVAPLEFTRWRPSSVDAELPDTLEFRGEFGSELACFLPFIYWLHSIGGMNDRKILTYSGMRPFYYFLSPEQYTEKSERRRHYQTYNRSPFTPNIDEHIAFRKPLEFYPDYRSVYRNAIFRMDRPILVIHNKYNKEWDGGPVNHLGLELLDKLLGELRHHFFCVYIRPGISTRPSDFSEDANTVFEFDDRDVLSSYDDVLIFDDLASRFNGGSKYNLLKNLLYANTHHFICAQGGASYHPAMFSGSCIAVNHKVGLETQFAYAHGLYRHLSNPCPIMLITKNDDSLLEAAFALTRSKVMVDRVCLDPKDLIKLEPLMPTPAPILLNDMREYFAKILSTKEKADLGDDVEKSQSFRRVEAIHPHWRGFLRLSDTDNSILHEGPGSKGTYQFDRGKLHIRWDKFAPEVFVEHLGRYVQEEILKEIPPIIEGVPSLERLSAVSMNGDVTERTAVRNESMEQAEQMSRLEEKAPAQDHLGQTLIAIRHQASEGFAREAAATLQSAIDRCSEVEFDANCASLLAGTFVVLRPELTGALLARKFAPNCRVAVQTSSNLSRPFLILFEKIRHDEISLTFSSTLAAYSKLEVQMLWLMWVMPLLVRVAASRNVSDGKAFLNQWDAGIVPGLSYCASGNGFFLIPDNVFIPRRGYWELKQELANERVDWSERQPIAFWRGAATGQVLDPSRGWRSLQRVGLCELSKEHPSLIDAGLSEIAQLSAEDAVEVQKSCLVKDYYPAKNLQRYRYLIDVDGNSNAWGGFFERLLTGSPVLKVASPRGYQQWYYDRLRPWHNFVPVLADMSDLVCKIQWLKQHDTEARAIGENGRALAYSIEYEAELDRAMDTVSAAFRAFSAARSATAYNSVGAREQNKYTHHRTILAYDRESRAVVHVAPELATLNLTVLPLTLEEVGGDIYLKTPLGEYIVDIDTDGNAKLATKPTLESRRACSKTLGEEASYTFKFNDNFACAEPDGRVTVKRKIASQWELFHVNVKDERRE